MTHSQRVSDEVSSALTAIHLYAELIARRKPADVELQSAIHQIYMAVDRAARALDGVRDALESVAPHPPRAAGRG